MIRALALSKLNAQNLPGDRFRKSLVKWWSTAAAHDAEKPASNDTNVKSELPFWIKSATEKAIFLAKNEKDLFSAAACKSFNSGNAISFINKLGILIAEGKIKPTSFHSMVSKKNIETLLMEGEFKTKIPQLINVRKTFHLFITYIYDSNFFQTVKNLLVLNYPPNSKLIKSVQMEMLFLLKTAPIKHIILVIEMCDKIPTSADQPPLLKEAVEHIQRRWVELLNVGDFMFILNNSSIFNQRFIEKIDYRLLECIEVYSQENRVKVQNRRHKINSIQIGFIRYRSSYV